MFELAANPWLTVAAEIASILSLAVSFYVWLRVGRLNKIFISKVRTPKLWGSLKRLSKELNEALQHYDASKLAVRDTLILAKAVLANLTMHLRGTPRGRAISLLRRTRAYLGQSRKDRLLRLLYEADSLDGCRAIYEAMSELEVTIGYYLEDEALRVGNGP